VKKIIAAAGSNTPVIAKLEKPQAIENLEEILAIADGVMVARGDLGVEIPIDEVPFVQKMIIKKANGLGKPVITATQMLDSMIRNPRPTRAEVSDVANAIYDGTDAIMLSGETAVGAYPFLAVGMMDQCARYTEPQLEYKHVPLNSVVGNIQGDGVDADNIITRSIAQATCDIACNLKAAAIVVATTSGASARAISRCRPNVPILAATTSPKTYAMLGLVWGVVPVLVKQVSTSDDLLKECVQTAVRTGAAKEGEIIVVTGGIPVTVRGLTNFLRVHRVGDNLRGA